MADINGRKKSASVWPWIIGAAIILVVVWGTINLLADRGREVPPAEQPRTDTLPDTFRVPPAM